MENKIKIFVPGLILILFTIELFSQNLVSNCSFERFDNSYKGNFSCNPIDRRGINIEGWYAHPYHGLPIYYFYRNNKNKDFDVPKNFEGYQEPKNGDAYIGINLKPLNCKGCQVTYNFIATKINEPLKKGGKYHIEFYINKTDDFDNSTNIIGIYHLKGDDFPANGHFIYKPLLIYHAAAPINNIENWVKIEGEFIASGGEKVIMIGNMENDTSVTTNYFAHQRGYYFLDDVCITEYRTDGKYDCSCKDIPDYNIDSLEGGQSLVIKDIFFEMDKSNLLPASFPSLKILAAQLNKYPLIKIKISGHTDNSGNFEYNMKLSEARAFAVMSYLIQKGVAMDRMVYKGYGSSKPVSDNSTEEGKAKNRRVEITMVKKY